MFASSETSSPSFLCNGRQASATPHSMASEMSPVALLGRVGASPKAGHRSVATSKRAVRIMRRQDPQTKRSQELRIPTQEKSDVASADGDSALGRVVQASVSPHGRKWKVTKTRPCQAPA